MDWGTYRDEISYVESNSGSAKFCRPFSPFGYSISKVGHNLSHIFITMNIESLQHYCMSLPGATEAIRWEHHLNFYVGGKMFCISTLDADGRVSFKVPEEEYEEIAARPGMIPAPYLARMKWVFVEHYDSLSDDEWRRFLVDSYRLVRAKLPKKVQAELPKFSGG